MAMRIFLSYIVAFLILALAIITISCTSTQEEVAPTPTAKPSHTLIPSPKEPPEIDWAKTFGGPEIDDPSSLQQTADGGYIIAGKTQSYGAGWNDFWLVKTDTEGYEEWSRTFGQSGDDVAKSVQQTSDGGYIIAGVTNSYGVQVSDMLLVKTDADGEEEWSKTYGGSGGDGAYFVQQTSDGGYIAAGGTGSYGAVQSDFWLVKTDADGEEIWNNNFGSHAHEIAKSAQQTDDNGYIIAGFTSPDASTTMSDAWIVKTDDNGNEIWSKTFGGPDEDTVFSIQQTSDNGYIACGTTGPYGGVYDDFWLIKMNQNGEEEWSKTFGPYCELGTSVQQTADGGYIITGTTYLDGASGFDIWLVKTDSEGTMEWNKFLGGPDSEYADYVQETSDGGYIVVGSTNSYGAGSFDFWLVKLK